MFEFCPNCRSFHVSLTSDGYACAKCTRTYSPQEFHQLALAYEQEKMLAWQNHVAFLESLSHEESEQALSKLKESRRTLTLKMLHRFTEVKDLDDVFFVLNVTEKNQTEIEQIDKDIEILSQKEYVF